MPEGALTKLPACAFARSAACNCCHMASSVVAADVIQQPATSDQQPAGEAPSSSSTHLVQLVTAARHSHLWVAFGSRGGAQPTAMHLRCPAHGRAINDRHLCRKARTQAGRRGRAQAGGGCKGRLAEAACTAHPLSQCVHMVSTAQLSTAQRRRSPCIQLSARIGQACSPLPPSISMRALSTPQASSVASRCSAPQIGVPPGAASTLQQR